MPPRPEGDGGIGPRWHFLHPTTRNDTFFHCVRPVVNGKEGLGGRAVVHWGSPAVGAMGRAASESRGLSSLGSPKV